MQKQIKQDTKKLSNNLQGGLFLPIISTFAARRHLISKYISQLLLIIAASPSHFHYTWQIITKNKFNTERCEVTSQCDTEIRFTVYIRHMAPFNLNPLA